MEEKQPTYGNGKICYIELPATDINVSASFYKNVFGWNIRDRSDGAVSFDDSVTEVSGSWVTGRKPHTGEGLTIHIMVFSMLSTIDEIIANGGKITQYPDTNATEVVAAFSDPAGNVLGLYQHTA